VYKRQEKSFGMRLNIAAGTAVRFEPGEEKEVQLVCFAGNNEIYGFNNLVDGELNSDNKKIAIEKSSAQNFKNSQS
jgi:urease subunit beta